jgi:hypothetical protein
MIAHDVEQPNENRTIVITPYGLKENTVKSWLATTTTLSLQEHQNITLTTKRDGQL